MTRLVVALALIAGSVSCTGTEPRSRAERISSRDQLIGGPKAIGDIGDYLLENDRIRLVIADKVAGRGVTLFGGSVLDADLVRPGGDESSGRDQLTELLPGFLFEVIEPREIVILADGSGGGPAQVAIRGNGGDLIEALAVLNTGLLYPPSLEFEQIYSLYPGQSHVEITTRVTNVSPGAHPLPYLNPSELRDLGLEVDGLEELTLSSPFGHLLLVGKEQNVFAPGEAGFNTRFTVEDSYLEANGFPAFPGLVVDFVASSGQDVSYGIAVPAEPSNYPSAYRDLYQPQQVKDTSMLVAFMYSSLIGIYTANPPPVLAAGDTFEYTTYFIVGRGDVGSIADVVYDLQGVPTGSFAGRVFDATSGAPVETDLIIWADGTDDIISQVKSDAGGVFRCNLPAGRYRYMVVDDDRPRFEPRAMTIEVDRTHPVVLELDSPGRLELVVRDETGRAVPARIIVVGNHDTADIGRDPRTFLYSLEAGERMRGTAFDGETARYIEKMVVAPLGRIEAIIRPGDWQVWVVRGPEYQAEVFDVSLAAGQSTSREVVLRRAYQTDGWVASDFHLHSSNSADSSLSLPDRVTSLAAEGLEFVAATDHNFITDYAPYITGLGLDPFITSVPGIELTTIEMGHFNGYPLRFDPGRARGGDFVFGGLTPDEMFAQIRQDLAEPGKEPIVQVNHPRDGFLGYFNTYSIDPVTGDPRVAPGLRGVFSAYSDEFQPEAFSWDFDAIEVFNGKRQELNHTYRVPDPLPPGTYPDPQPVPGEILVDATGKAKFPGHIEDWFVLLNRGMRVTATANSDSHGVMFEEPGYARSFVHVGQGADSQGAFRARDVMDGIRNHRVVLSNGPFIDMRIGGAGIGDQVTGSPVTVDITVSAPDWAPVDTVTVWLGGEVAETIAVPADAATDFERSVELSPAGDSWVVVEASGQASMFPILTMQEFEGLNADVIVQAVGAGFPVGDLSLTGPLKPDRTREVTPLALTNPIWIDGDGDGQWTPRLPPVPQNRSGQPAPRQDLRQAFDQLQEARP